MVPSKVTNKVAVDSNVMRYGPGKFLEFAGAGEARRVVDANVGCAAFANSDGSAKYF